MSTLCTEYKKKNGEETNVTRYLTYAFGLAFLKPKCIGDCFALDFEKFGQGSEIATFSDYLAVNYIAEESNFLHTYEPNIKLVCNIRMSVVLLKI